MRAARRFLVALIAVSVLLAAAPVVTAGALDQWTWYYMGENNYPVDTGTPGGTKGAIEVPVANTVGFAAQAGWAAAANAAMGSWDSLAGGMEFAHSNTAVPDFNPNDCNPPTPEPNAFHVGNASGNLAYTRECFGQPYRVTSFQVVVDPGAANWNTNLAVNPTGAQHDLWAVIAHELGHASGWSNTHYQGCSNWDGFGNCIGTLETSEPAADCGAVADRQTMCATNTAGDAGQRSLGNDDRITFYNAYPKPTRGTPVDGLPDICAFTVNTDYQGVYVPQLPTGSTSQNPIIFACP